MAGVVVEPIQSEGGDYHGSPTFFQHLQKITKQVRMTKKTKFFFDNHRFFRIMQHYL